MQPPDLKTPPKAKRANRGRKRQVILIDDITEIPALEFDRWLKDSSELVGRPKRVSRGLHLTYLVGFSLPVAFLL